MRTYTTIDQRRKTILKNTFFGRLRGRYISSRALFSQLFCEHVDVTSLYDNAKFYTTQQRIGKVDPKNCVFWLPFFNVDRSLYTFPCFVFLVILMKCPCYVIIHSCLILCNTTKNLKELTKLEISLVMHTFSQSWLGWIFDPDLVVHVNVPVIY